MREPKPFFRKQTQSYYVQFGKDQIPLGRDEKEARAKYHRLTDPVFKMCRWLARCPRLDTDHVFLNTRGKPYTKDCFCQQMGRIRKRAGIAIKGGEQLVLYSNRHTFGTENAGKVSDIELAELMGHTEARTTHRYIHLNADHLHDIRRRAQG